MEKTQIKNETDVRALLAMLNPQKTASWIYCEESRFLAGGGELTVRGFKCSHCGFFRRKKNGKSKFCEDCGFKMDEQEERT